MKDSLKLRKQIKAKKPNFTQQDNHKKGKLYDKWRRPKGGDSKIRLNMHGYKRKPTKGFKSPRDVRGALPDGKMPVIVFNAKQIEGIDKGTQAIIIASSVGTKKKLDLIQKAQEKGISISNVKDPSKFIESTKQTIEQKKQEKSKKEKEKQTKAKEKEQKAKEKASKKDDADKKDDELAGKVEEADKKANERKEIEKKLIHSE